MRAARWGTREEKGNASVLGRILVVLGGLMVVALTAALLVPFFIDWTDFRTNFEDQASRIIGKKVVVHGKVDARLLPFPSVTMTDVRVGQDGEGEPVLTVAEFSMDAELAPLMSGEARIYEMHVKSPKLHLKLNEDGTLDWVKTGNPLIPARTVVLERVDISNGEIIFEDAQTGRTRTAKAVNADLSARTLAGPWRIDGKANVDGEDFTFNFAAALPDDKGGVALKSRIMPARYPIKAELDGLIRFVDLKPRYEGTFSLRQRPADKTAEDNEAAQAAGPRLSGKFALANDSIRLPSYELQLGSPTDPYIVTGEATLDTGKEPQFLLKAEGQQIDMTRLGTQPEGENQEVAASPLTARLQAALAIAADIPIPQVPGKAEIRLPAVIAGDTTIRDIVLHMQPDKTGWQIDQAEAQLPGRTKMEAEGRLNLIGDQSFSGHLLLASNQPSGFAEWVAGSVPNAIRGLKTAGFEANVDLTNGYQRFDRLEIALGPLSLKGSLEREEQVSGTPALSVDLAGNGFDYEAVAALAQLLTGNGDAASLMANDVAARLDLGTFTAFGLSADRVQTAFSVSDGTIKVDRLDIGNLAGATITATGKLDGLPDKPVGQGRLTLKNGPDSTILSLIASHLPAHPALKTISAIEGRFAPLDLALDLSAGTGDWPIEARIAGTAAGTKLKAKLASQSINLADSGGMTLDLSAENDELTQLFGQFGLPVLPLETGTKASLALKIDQAPDSDPQLVASLTTPDGKAGIEGQTSLSADHFLEGSYQASIRTGDIEPTLMANGVSIPGLGAGLPVDLQSTLYVMPEAIVIESLAGSVADNPVSASLSLSRRQSPAVLDGSMTLGNADLGWLAESVFGPVQDAIGNFNGAALPVPQVPLVNLKLDITADSLTAGSLPTVTQASLHLDSDQGKLTIGKLAGTMAKGRLSGQMELSNAEGSGLLQGRFELHDASLPELIAQAGVPVKADGKADLSLIIEASGKTVATMPDNASGSGTLTVDGLVVDRLNQMAFPLILSASERIEGEINSAAVTPLLRPALASGPFDAGRLSVPFTMAGGVLRAQTIMAQNNQARVTGSAELGLSDGRINASLRMAFEPGDQGLAGAEPAVTLSYAGLAQDPGVTLDPTELTNFLSLRKFEAERRRVDILQSALQEKQRLRREARYYKGLETERRITRERKENNERLFEAYQRILSERAKAEAELKKIPPVTDPNDVIIAPLPEPIQ